MPVPRLAPLPIVTRAGAEVSRRGRWNFGENARSRSKIKWRLLLPGASEPRLAELNPLGLQSGLSNCVTQPEQPEQSCRWQLLH